VGEWVRIGERRFRVIGVLADQGQTLAAPIDDVAVITVAAAQSLFNREGLFRILVQARGRDSLDGAEADILRIIRERHDGDEDITVIAQDALLSTFDRIFTVLNLAVAGIAGISLLVAGILIMNVMLVSVSQRTEEIGLLSALGASQRQILQLFLTEAALIALAGAMIGLITSTVVIRLTLHFYPDLPLQIPAWAIAAAVFVAFTTGLAFGVHPARKAASVDPVVALGSHHG
jgi:putative ABC transport system permease protein